MTLAIFLMAETAFAGPALAPYTCEEKFESGSVGPWSSYPPSQDTAYDPTIWVKPAGDGGKALFREVTPNYDNDCVFGVRRKPDLYIGKESMLSFRAYLKSNKPSDGITVKLGFTDGGSAEKVLTYDKTSSWQSFTVNLGEYASGGTPRKLDAVAFMALCPAADPENLLRFGVDDVRINGYREQQWEFSTPKTHRLEEWADAIAGTHYREGGAITISGRPPFTPRGVLVRVNRALTGDRGGIFPMKKTGDIWSVNIPLTEKAGLGPGFWRATVLTSTQSGETLSSTLVFLVKSPGAPQENPRLLMGPGDAPNVLAKAASGRLKTVWEGLQRSAANSRSQNKVEDFKYNLDAYDEVHWLPTYGGYVRAIRVPSGFIRSNGVVYGLSGDSAAGDAAGRALVQMAGWPSYVHPHILNQGQFTYWPVGQMLADMAIGYDMARSGMSAEDRRTVARALYSKGVTEVFREYVRDNRVSSYTSNWIGDVTGGGILCSLAIMNDIPEEELEPYLSGMILKMDRLIENAFDRDGHYGEGYSYLNHALECINEAGPALARTFAVEFPEKLFKSYRFLLYQSNTGTRAVYDYGDSSDRLGGLSNFTWILEKSRSPHLKWLYDIAPGSRDVDLFHADESIPSQSPDNLPKTVHFRDSGTVIFRSGFAPEDFTFVFRCGAFYNHQHFDQGTFFLADRKDAFLVEGGRTDYYGDPWYQKLFIQPLGHNCILLDGNPESQRAGDLLKDVPAWRDYAAISDFFTFEGGAFTSGRLDPLYKGKIENLRRSALYLAPRTVVLIDEASGPKGIRTMDMLFHAPRRDDIAVSGNTATITRPAGKLFIRTLGPESIRVEIKKRPPSVYEFNGENAITMKARGYLQLSAGLGSNPVTVVNVLSTDEPLASSLQAENGSGFSAFSLGGIQYVVNTSGGKRFTRGEVETDALVHAIGPDGFLALRASTLVQKGRTLFSTDKPVNLRFRGDAAQKLSYAAPDGADLALRLGARPKQVILNGQRIRTWKFDAKSDLRLRLEPGEGTIEFR
jgi:hypothetical protein